MDEEAIMRTLQARLGQLGIGGDGEGEGESQPPPKVLEELTIEGVVKHIQKLKSSENSEQYIGIWRKKWFVVSPDT